MNTGSNFWKSFSFIYHRWLLALLPVLRRGMLLADASFLICISAHQCVFGWFGFVINKNKEKANWQKVRIHLIIHIFFFPFLFFCDSQIVSRYTPPPPPPLACSVCLLLYAYLKNTHFEVRSVTSVLYEYPSVRDSTQFVSIFDTW